MCLVMLFIARVARLILCVVVLVPCALLPYRWMWPLCAVAAILLIAGRRAALAARLRQWGILILGVPIMLAVRTWFDPMVWAAWWGIIFAVTALNAWLDGHYANPLRLKSSAFEPARNTATRIPAAWHVGRLIVIVAAAWLVIGGGGPFGIASPDATHRDALLVCAGDSLTAGVGSGTDRDTYVARLRDILPCRILNAGRAADRVADLLARFDRDVARHQPSHILLFIGGNDYMDGTPRADFARDFERLLVRARQCAAVTVVEVPTGIVWSPYGGVYRTLAKKHGAALVPESMLRWWFTRELLIGSSLSERLTIDGIHLSAVGATSVAAWLAPYLQA